MKNHHSIITIKNGQVKDTSKDPKSEYRTYAFDHRIETFEIQIRTMGGVNVDKLKRLIEQQYEVLCCDLAESIQVNRECAG